MLCLLAVYKALELHTAKRTNFLLSLPALMDSPIDRVSA
jgi:hypothetical protein